MHDNQISIYDDSIEVSELDENIEMELLSTEMRLLHRFYTMAIGSIWISSAVKKIPVVIVTELKTLSNNETVGLHFDCTPNCIGVH